MIRFLFLFSLAFLSIIDINCGRNSKKNTDKADKTNKVDKKKNKENKKHPKKLNISNKNKSSDNNNEDEDSIIENLFRTELYGTIKSQEDDSKKDISTGTIPDTSTRNFDIYKLRSEDNLYKSLQKKYDDRSKLNILSSSIVDNYIINIRKELFFSDNPCLTEKHSSIIEAIFEGIRNNKITAFSDVNLKVEVDLDRIKDKMIKPVVLDTRRRRKPVQRYFKNLDVDNIEIIGNIFWSMMSQNMILDYLVVKLAIPTSKSKLDSEIVICYINYSNFINYLRNASVFIDIDGTDVNLADAIINDKLNIMYTYISDNNKVYNLPDGNFEENNFYVRNLINKLENDFYSYNIPLKI